MSEFRYLSPVPPQSSQQRNGPSDPSQLTVFAPLPSETESISKHDSILFKVFKKVTGNTGASTPLTAPVSRRTSSQADVRNLTQTQRGVQTAQRPRARAVDGNGVLLLQEQTLSPESDPRGPPGAGGSFYSPASPFSGYQSTVDAGRATGRSVSGSGLEEHPRNLGSVLERIKVIRSKGSQDLQPYRDNDFKQYWMPDSSSKECYDCGEKFTTFRRRRHCRVCGQIFCTRCANQEMDGRLLGYSGTIRMCSFCSQVVLGVVRCANDASPSASVNNTLTHKKKLLDDIPDGSARKLRYQPFSGQSESDKGTESHAPQRSHSNDFRSMPFEQLREIWLEMNHIADGLELKIHRHRFRAFPECVSGVEIVDWLIKRGTVPNRKLAVRIGQGLLNYKFLECLTGHETVFADEYALYKPKTVTNELEDVAVVSSVELIDNEEPTWLQEINQLDQVRMSHSDPSFDYSASPDVNHVFIQEFGSEMRKKFAERSDSMVSLSSQIDTDHPLTISVDTTTSHTPPPLSPSVASHAPSVSIPEDVAFGNLSELDFWKDPESADINFEVTENEHVTAALNNAFQQRMRALLNQLQVWEGLDKEWHEHILALASKVTENVVPSVGENRDEMDIRHYVHIKKVPGGRPAESRVVFGVVCTKHVAHRKMRQNFVNPKILLYGSALEYQRVEQKLSSLEPIMQQEAEFLKNYVAKISEFQPDILLVERNVSRLAQDYLFQEGITLAANLKEAVMRRIARCTSADKLSIIDGRFTKPRLGTCAKFDVKSIILPDGQCKAYMTIDGCPKQLGCTVLLRGPTKEVLVKVKSILKFVVYCMYNWRLEKAFLVDEHAKPPDGEEVFCGLVHNTSDFREIARSFLPSISPYIHHAMPYLEWGEYQKDLLRNRYNLPQAMFWSKLLDGYCFPNTPLPDDKLTHSGPSPAENGTKPRHALLGMKFTTGVSDASIQKALTSFRAYGGCPSVKNVPQEESSVKTTSTAGPIDCFDVYRHQRLAILCSIHARELDNLHASFCVMPWILVIEFYGKNDLTLGDYLETFCFRDDAPCPNQQCHRGVREHSRRFASNEAVISVVLKEFGDGGGAGLKRLVTWTWCTICGDVGPVVPLSTNSSALSFAKYLDLRFHASAYVNAACSSCQHSLHREHIQFFAFGRTVAAFKLTAIQVREIAAPPPVISMDDYRSLPDRHELIEMIKVVAVKGHNVFATVIELLSVDLEKMEHLLAVCRSEKQMFKDRLECLQVKLASPLLKFHGELQREEKEQQRDFVWDIMDMLTNLRREITETAARWSGVLADWKKKQEKKGTMKAFQSTPEFVREDVGFSVPPIIVEESPEGRKFSIEVGDSEENEDVESFPMENPSVLPREMCGLRHSVTSVGIHGMAGEMARDHVDSGMARLPPVRQRSTGYSVNAVPIPFPPNEHYFTGDSDNVPVIVYDDEISSMIAYVLSSTDYANQLAELRRTSAKEIRQSRNVSGEPGVNTSRRQSPSSLDVPSRIDGPGTGLTVEQSGLSSYDDVEQETAATNIKPASRAAVKGASITDYIEMQFADVSAKFYCRVYFPEEFRQLRALVFPYGEDRYIRSLARCVAWKASGGKSGSTFSKTADGRFVLKQMSRLEAQSFVEFAPHYFAYMRQAVREKRPTVLAKVVGVYRIGFRNSQTGAVAKQDLLIMENLFYGRSVQQVYDLKGSLRNRLASTDGKADAPSAEMVLLDENFLKRICDNPLYIRPHAKQFLRAALRTDTQFLASQYVMDYSLLVGVDEDNQEIVVGIIDYVRTFTWDKRLEMVVKSAGILGGGTGVAKLPTIVSPEVYRSRFVEAMDGYFLSVPDQWYGLARYLPGT